MIDFDARVRAAKAQAALAPSLVTITVPNFDGRSARLDVATHAYCLSLRAIRLKSAQFSVFLLLL